MFIRRLALATANATCLQTQPPFVSLLSVFLIALRCTCHNDLLCQV